MRRFLVSPLLILIVGLVALAQQPGDKKSPDDQYVPGPDSLEQAGVPKGEVIKREWNDSKVYPGTVRNYWVYVPKQYHPKQPACVFVCQDKILYNATTVFDNLIHKKEMPVTIGIFIEPGDVPLQPGEAPRKRPDGRPAARKYRSVEYDTLSDVYAKFLLEEILPTVAKDYNLTKDPEGRCIAGSSSGGICAFTVCWERPDAFRKCFTTVGSFTNIRGGNKYPELVRSAPKKPIRIFQQDGSNDIVNQYGSWPEANKAMAAALTDKGYDHKFVFGEGVHSGKHGTAIFPEVMRWMWRDWPGVGTKSNGLNLAPPRGTLKAYVFQNSVVNIPPTLYFSLSVPLPPFEFENKLQTAALRLNFIDFGQFGVTDWRELPGRTFDFPKNPAKGFIDGWMQVANDLTPVTCTQIRFGKLEGDTLPAAVKIESDSKNPAALGKVPVTWNVELSADVAELDRVTQEAKRVVKTQR